MTLRVRLGALALLATVLWAPHAGRALEIEFSNPYHYVFNGITQSKIGEDFATFAVNENQSNAIGDLQLSSDLGYATAEAENDPFQLRASSSADGANLVSLGLDSVSSEGLARFQVDFVVIADEPEARLDIAYLFSSGFVSTDPRIGFGPGTIAILGMRSITVWQGDQFVFGDNVQDGAHVLEGVIQSGMTYQLRMVLNAVSGVRDSTGFASATAGLDAALSVHPVPEPATASLLAAALAALAWRRRERRGVGPTERG